MAPEVSETEPFFVYEPGSFFGVVDLVSTDS